MPKNGKKEKKVVNLQPQYHLSKEQLQAPKRKRPKNAPDKPQPAWMFPPDEENPVLNPKTKTAQQLEFDKKEKAASVDFLHHKSVGAPMRPAPPQLLVSLVGAYLTSYGFDGASRLYTTQLSARKKLDDWKITVDYPIPKGTPNLVQIFKQWHKDFELREDPSETSSSDSDDSLDTKVRKTNSKASKAAAKAATGDETSSSGESEEEDATSEESGSDIDMKDASPPPRKAKKAKEGQKTKATQKAKKRSAPSTSTSATSDSEADDELESSGAAIPKIQNAPPPMADSKVAESSSDPSSDSEAEVEAPSTPAVITKSSRVTSSDSSSDDSDEPEAPPTTTTVITETTTTKAPPSSSDSSSSDSSDSDSERLPAQTTTTTTTTSIINPRGNRGSDSSETLVATTPTTNTTTAIPPASSGSSSTSSSDSEEEPPLNKRKRSLSPVPGSTKMLKKSNTPFQRVPSSTKVDERFKSNAYQPYDYANRAHQDLVVTKGRGFTKEKNKKKRGTYRGGAIDVNEGGGKGIRFD
ncbi:MAG: jun-like transcription factor [Ramalina farinacea]|uniref:Jun-like transcription factor n=1 Tax=Ramalina farinacea TaxID=258253 RepID=A0AA43U0X7_9LECA|nr:jun-like transcription factor [Ramalina farinacea]